MSVEFAEEKNEYIDENENIQYVYLMGNIEVNSDLSLTWKISSTFFIKIYLQIE